MKKEGALSKFGEGVIDNQWFKGAKMTIVPRPFEESRKGVPTPRGKWKMENGKLKIEAFCLRVTAGGQTGGVRLMSRRKRRKRRNEYKGECFLKKNCESGTFFD
ncbi:MAG: hypothetical protein E7074_05225 [Bacteroidales bacterium]|nr:hypothetical protein [Bacteroidales bacterium]